MALFATARNGSMLSEPEVNELTSFYQFITQEMIINYGNRSVTYDNLCDPFCDFNSQIWKMLVIFDLIYLVTNKICLGF